MDAKKELGHRGEEGVLVQNDVPQVQNQGKEISREQMKATFPLPNGEEPSKMILARDWFQELQTVQDGKERKVRNGELEIMEVETESQQKQEGMKFLHVIDQNVMQSPSLEQAALVPKGGGKWKKDQQKQTGRNSQEKWDNKENEIRLETKEGCQ